jgi:hypothetical protein
MHCSTIRPWLLVNELLPYGMDQIKGYGQNRVLRS